MSSVGVTNSSRSAWAWASCTSEPADGWATPESPISTRVDAVEGVAVAEGAVADEQHAPRRAACSSEARSSGGADAAAR